jgi:vancomycin resistance protein YoaR
MQNSRKNKSKRSKNSKDRKNLVYLKLIVYTFLFSFFLLLFIDFFIHTGRVHAGVRIQGVNLSFTDRKSGPSLIKNQINSFLKEEVRIRFHDREWRILPRDFKVKVDYEKTWEKAYVVGRSSDFFDNVKKRILLYFKPEIIEPSFTYERKKLEKFVEELSRQVDKKPKDASLEIRGVEIIFRPSSIGRKVDREKAVHQIAQAFVSRNRFVELPVSLIPAEVTDEEAKRAVEESRVILSAPVYLKYNRYRWRIDPEDLANFIIYEKSTVYRPLLDKRKLKDYLSQFTDDFRIPAKDAEFIVKGRDVEISPSREGREIDLDKAYEDISEVVREKKTPREVLLVTKKIYPHRTTEEAREMGIETRLASFTTYYNPRQTARVNNIHLLAKSLDGALVPPGKVFSVNDWVGPRTAAKGYKEAPTIINGRLLPSFGGGVCQVATTFFNAIFFAGLPVVERHNHSFYISRYPTGRDASLSYGTLDLKFKNDTGAYILIKAWYSSSSVTFALYGKKMDFEVKYKTYPARNFKPYKTEYIKDPTLPEGKEIVEEKGVEGRDITVVRWVYRNGKLWLKDTFFSRYRPKKKIVRIGTKKMEESETTPTAETTSLP